jgi:hypothetical protein
LLKRLLLMTGIEMLLLTSCLPATFSVDGNMLVTYLREYEKAVREEQHVTWENVGMFRGYVLAIADSPGVESCITEGVLSKQLTTVVAKYLNDHPSEWNKPATLLVQSALKQAFCKDEGAGKEPK